jgi:hypothetical protein
MTYLKRTSFLDFARLNFFLNWKQPNFARIGFIVSQQRQQRGWRRREVWGKGADEVEWLKE